MSEPWPVEGDDLQSQMSLAELVNRVLDKGAIVTGEVTISVAGVDLIFLGLQLVIAAAESLQARPGIRGLAR
ncbi:MAG TPA: gas vesicle protein [Longimicrobiales bacterium]